MWKALLVSALVGSVLAQDSIWSPEQKIWSQKRDTRSILDGIFRAAESCELTAYINRVGRANIQRALGQLSREEAAKYEAFIQERLRAEADSTCRSRNTQAALSQTALSQTDPFRSTLNDITRAAQSCELTTYITKVGGMPVIEKTLAQLSREEQEKYGTFIKTQMQAEADGTCGRTQTGTSQTADAVQSTLDDILQAAASCELTTYISKVGMETVQKTLSQLSSEEQDKYWAFIKTQMQAEADGTCTRRQSRQIDEARRVMTGLLQASLDCQLTSFVNRIDPQLLQRAFAAMGDDAARIRQFVSEKLREESAGRCGGDGPVRTETRPPTRPTTSRPRLDTAVSGQDATVRRVVEGVFQAASQCRLTAFVRSVDRQLLARVINSFGDRATRFEQFIGQSLQAESLGRCARTTA